MIEPTLETIESHERGTSADRCLLREIRRISADVESMDLLIDGLMPRLAAIEGGHDGLVLTDIHARLGEIEDANASINEHLAVQERQAREIKDLLLEREQSKAYRAALILITKESHYTRMIEIAKRALEGES